MKQLRLILLILLTGTLCAQAQAQRPTFTLNAGPSLLILPDAENDVWGNGASLRASIGAFVSATTELGVEGAFSFHPINDEALLNQIGSPPSGVDLDISSAHLSLYGGTLYGLMHLGDMEARHPFIRAGIGYHVMNVGEHNVGLESLAEVLDADGEGALTGIVGGGSTFPIGNIILMAEVRVNLQNRDDLTIFLPILLGIRF